MNDYKPQAGDLIEVANLVTGERERAFVHVKGGGLRIRYEHGVWDYARDAIDPVLLDRKPTPWPTTPGSTARLTIDGCDHWAVLSPFAFYPALNRWFTGDGENCTEAEMRADGWTPVHDAGADQ